MCSSRNKHTCVSMPVNENHKFMEISLIFLNQSEIQNIETKKFSIFSKI